MRYAAVQFFLWIIKCYTNGLLLQILIVYFFVYTKLQTQLCYATIKEYMQVNIFINFIWITFLLNISILLLLLLLLLYQ